MLDFFFYLIVIDLSYCYKFQIILLGRWMRIFAFACLWHVFLLILLYWDLITCARGLNASISGHTLSKNSGIFSVFWKNPFC